MNVDPVWVKFSDMLVDPEVQSRCEIDEAYCRDLKDEYDYRKDKELPLVFRVAADGRRKYLLAVGFQRRHALQDLRGEKGMWCRAQEGDRDDAVLASVGSNDTPLRPRSRADRERSVGMLLDSPKWSSWSDVQIARAANVQRDVVVSVRAGRRRAAAEAEARRRAAQEEERARRVGAPPPPQISLAGAASENERTYTNKHGQVGTMKVGQIGGPRRPRAAAPGEVDDLKERARRLARKLWRLCLPLADLLGRESHELFAAHGRWAEAAEEAARRREKTSTVPEP